MTVDAEDVERVIAACSTVPLAELDAHLEVFLSKRPFYVPSIGEGAEEAEEVEVDIKALRRLIEAKAEANGAQEGEWTRQDVDELDDAALLSKVLLVNARVRRAKAMVSVCRKAFRAFVYLFPFFLYFHLDRRNAPPAGGGHLDVGGARRPAAKRGGEAEDGPAGQIDDRRVLPAARPPHCGD